VKEDAAPLPRPRIDRPRGKDRYNGLPADLAPVRRLTSLEVRMKIPATWLLVLLPLSAIVSAEPPDPCSQFSWNVTHELELFAAVPTPSAAGKDEASAPLLAPERVYELTLTPQSQVTFPLSPGKKALTDGAFAGLAQVRITTPGRYRVSLDGPFWIDIVAKGKLLVSTDFTGNHECKSLRKLVEFQLPAGKVFLQLSGAGQEHVRVALTRSPTAPKP
jgi:hypothetical protein